MKICVALAGALLMTGCAWVRPPPETAPGVAAPEAWRERQAALADFDHWSLQGRAATGKLLGWSGNLSWRQRGERFDVRLSGPLGAGGFAAEGTLDLVTVQAKGETFYTTEPEALVEEVVGWRFPLTGLRYWVIGLPEPGRPAVVSVDDTGRLVGLEQSGWRLAYPEYRKTADGFALPRRIVLSSGENTIKLVVDRWFDIEAAAGGR